MSDPITLGELRVILERIPRSLDRCLIELVVFDDEALGIEDAPGIKMKGLYDFTSAPITRGDELIFYAGGEALV